MEKDKEKKMERGRRKELNYRKREGNIQEEN